MSPDVIEKKYLDLQNAKKNSRYLIYCTQCYSGIASVRILSLSKGEIIWEQEANRS
jgi:hypothetical protein